LTTPLLTNAGTLALSATGANIVTASTNGVERLRIDSAGNVGIGTSSPTHTLQVNSGAATSTMRLQANAGVDPLVSFLRGVTDVAQINGFFAGLQMNGSQVIRLDTGGTERLRIDSAGNVGIGTVTPGKLLELSQAGATTVRLRSTDGGDPELSLFSAGVRDWRVAGGSDLKVLGDNFERLRIDSDGKVGIGTTDIGPTRLDINGFDGNIRLSQTDANNTNKFGRVILRHFDNSQNNTFVVGGLNTSTQNEVNLGGGSGVLNQATVLRFFTAANNTTVGSNERMRISSAGSILMGRTTNLNNETLHVTGDGRQAITAQVTNNNNSLFQGFNATDGLAFQVTGAGNATIFGALTTPLVTNAGTLALSATGANIVTASTNGVERLRIDSSGNVGIGTSAPAVALDVARSLVGITDNLILRNTAAAGNGRGSRQQFVAGNGNVIGELNARHEGGTTNGSLGISSWHNNAQFANITFDNNFSGSTYRSPIRHDFVVDGSERLRITSAGNVGIGTSAPNNLLHVRSGTDGGGLTLQRNSVTADTFSQLAFSPSTDDSGTPNLWIRGVRGSSFANNYLTIGTNNAERLRIDSAGNVGIGISSISRGELQINAASGSTELHMTNTGTGTGSSDGFTLFMTEDGEGAGVWLREAEPLRFATSATERMRIDASGNLLVGKTASAIGTAGAELQTIGRVLGTADANVCFIANRLTNDGEIMQFRKDGTTMGSIGTLSSRLVVGSGSTAVTFADNLNPKTFYPSNTSGTGQDASIALGTTTSRFKDLFLSGGVYLGGTAAANKLDDYEEGTWTPDLEGVTVTTALGRYTKIGNIVTAQFSIDSDGVTNSSFAQLKGLPFSAEDSTSSNPGRSAGFLTNNTSGTSYLLFFAAGTTEANFRDASTGIRATRTDISGNFFAGTFVYRAI
jgi:hypothetical protein